MTSTRQWKTLWLAAALLACVAVQVRAVETLLSDQLFSPDTRFIFEHITVDDGLPENSVRAMIQDQSGFLWFGTQNGLVRYDGYEMKVFAPSPNDTTSFGGRTVLALCEDNSGTIWIGTFLRGLWKYDPRLGTFRHVSLGREFGNRPAANQVQAIVEGPDGRIWVGMQYGLVSIDPIGGGVTWHDEMVPADLERKTITVISILIDQRGRIWCGTESSGIVVNDPESGELSHHYLDEDNIKSLANRTVRQLAQSPDGKIWAATDGGLCLWQEASGDFIRFIPSTDEMSAANVMVCIAQDPRGLLWIGSGSGLYLFDPEHRRFRFFTHVEEDPFSPVNGPILSVMIDGSGILWAGSWLTGLNKVDPGGGMFNATEFSVGGSSLSVEALLEDRQGQLYVGTSNVPRGWGRGNVFRRAPNSSEFLEIHHDPENQPASILSLHEDGQGRIWVGTFRGLWKLEDGRILRVDLGDDQVRNSPIKAMVSDPEGRLWLATATGAYRWNIGTGELVRFQHNLLDPHSVSSDDIVSIHLDRTGRLWLGTDALGLNLYRSDETGFLRFFDPEVGLETVSSIQEAAGGELYLASFSGLVKFDPSTGSTSIVNRLQGLPNDQVVSILEDRRGHLWLSTGYGMARYDPGTGQVKTFDVLDGLPDNEVRFATLASRTGRLYFGGRGGLVSLDPEKFSGSRYSPPVVITRIQLLDTEMTIAPGSPLETLSHLTRDIELSHDQNDLSFTFASLDYVRPDQNRYRYRMTGHDDGWRDPGPSRKASYTSLAPGSYVFEVRGTNRDGVWSPVQASLAIRIHPPWWKTGWAFALYIVSFLSVAGFFLRQLILRERMRANLALQKARSEQLEELDQMKSRFLTNITHEFRTPLTLIKAPLMRLQREQDGRPDSTTDTMLRNADRLERLIDQLLDLSRLEAGRLPVEWQHGNGLAYLREFALGFEPLALQREIVLTVNDTGEEPDGWFGADLLEKLLGNLLSNAVKHTPDHGTIVVTLNLDDEVRQIFPPQVRHKDRPRIQVLSRRLTISVRNSGSFIPAKEFSRLFDRFYQASTVGGSGVGLALVKELTQWLGGTVEVTSNHQTGTCFTSQVPLFLEHPEGLKSEDSFPESTELADGGSGTESTVEDSVVDEAKILVVEDNPDLRGFIREELAEEFEVLEAEDGKRGLELAVGEIPDLIISDVMMPRMDGFELSRRLREDERTNHIPIILLTAKSDEESKIHGLKLGADDYLTKPFDVEELRLKVSNQIEKRLKLARRYEQQLATLTPDAMPVVSSDERFLALLREVIETHIDDPEFKIDALCREVGMSRSQLHRKLKAVTGKSTSDFVRTHRLQRAAQLFEGGYGNVTEVAYAVGFRNLSYFSRSFKDLYGVQPSEYLKHDPA